MEFAHCSSLNSIQQPPSNRSTNWIIKPSAKDTSRQQPYPMELSTQPQPNKASQAALCQGGTKDNNSNHNWPATSLQHTHPLGNLQRIKLTTCHMVEEKQARNIVPSRPVAAMPQAGSKNNTNTCYYPVDINVST